MTLTDSNDIELYVHLEPTGYHESTGNIQWAYDTFGDGWEVTHHNDGDVLDLIIQTLYDENVQSVSEVLSVFPVGDTITP